MWARILAFLVEWVGTWVVGLLCRSLRLRVVGGDRREALHRRHGAVCGCCWHALMLVPLFHNRHSAGCALVSEHRDGELIARVLRRLGYTLVRGSTTRGAARALVQLVRAAREGRDLAFTPDGPRGPRYVAQPGVVYVAAKTGCPIIPVGFAAARYWEFHSWDRFRLPKPFSRAELRYGEPLHVPPHLTEDDVELWRQRVEDALKRVTREAEEAMGLPPEEEEEDDG